MENVKTTVEKTFSKQYKRAFVSIYPTDAEPTVHKCAVRAAIYVKGLMQG